MSSYNFGQVNPLTMNQQKWIEILSRINTGSITSNSTYSEFTHTPYELCTSILNQVALSGDICIISNPEWLLCDVDYSKINSITFVTDCNLKHRYITALANKYNIPVTIVGMNLLLEGKINMKFDVVVGNPPYQKQNSKAKRWTLWEEFVKKSKSLADTVIMVTPQSITSPGPFELIKENVTLINIDVSKYFAVGSTFCFWMIDTTKTINSTKIITATDEYQLDLTKIDFLPSTITTETLDLINSLTSRKSRTWQRGELHTSKIGLFSTNGKYEVMHTNAQTLKSDVEHPNRTKTRVAVTLSGYPTFKVITNGYTSQACFWTECDTIQDAQALADECNGPEIQKILSIFKWSGWNSKEVIKCL